MFTDDNAPNHSSPFLRYEAAALRGEYLIEDEVERNVKTWTSPASVARLLLTRRIPESLFCRTGQFRILGAVIPEFDHAMGLEPMIRLSPTYPALPLHLRPAWLAGVAMVHRAGPSMLDMLCEKLMNENAFCCDDFRKPSKVWTGVTEWTRQMQLIREPDP